MEIIVLLLFSLFVYAATSKLMDYKVFLVQMNDQPFDDKFSILLVWGLPALQYLIAGLLIFRRTLLAGLYGSLALMLIFTVYITLIKLNFFNHIPCSCGGVIKQFTWTEHLYFNLFFIIISLAGIVFHKWLRRNVKPTFEKIQLS
ncbi:MauE/DoxX family redox-associated membrane protein [Chitinophaga barathri]